MQIKEASYRWVAGGDQIVACAGESGYALEYQVERRHAEAAPLREGPENERADQSLPVEEARRLAHAILRLDGLTGAEIEAAERVLALDRADLQRLRQIAANHSMFTADFFGLNGSAHQAKAQRGVGLER